MEFLLFAKEQINCNHIVSIKQDNTEIKIFLSDKRMLTEVYYDTRVKGGYPAIVNVELRMREINRIITNIP